MAHIPDEDANFFLTYNADVDQFIVGLGDDMAGMVIVRAIPRGPNATLRWQAGGDYSWRLASGSRTAEVLRNDNNDYVYRETQNGVTVHQGALTDGQAFSLHDSVHEIADWAGEAFLWGAGGRRSRRRSRSASRRRRSTSKPKRRPKRKKLSRGAF